MKVHWHTLWQGHHIAVHRDDVEVDRFDAQQVERVLLLYKGSGDFPGDVVQVVVELPEESQSDAIEQVHAGLARAGYAAYELSNFHRAGEPGHRSRHNRKYWSHAPYLGIGPAASLLAAGKLSSSDKVVVAAFDAGADSSLGATIAEAEKTNLSQSTAVQNLPTSAVVAVLQQMQRPDTARVDYATAREIAQRSGAKAVVTGSIVRAGSGYLVTARLVEATSGNDLSLYTESANDVGDLIPAVDRLTKSLRRKMGESLKSVHNAPRLDQVTTASLGAL
jgi:hypothetical protein